MASIIREHGLVPRLLVHPNCVEDLLGEGSSADLVPDNPDCVVIGDAMHGFTYENMNKSFQLLMSSENVKLYSLGKGKYYQV